VARVVRRAAVVLVALCARPSGAQEAGGSLFERLNLDRLKLTALGVSAGRVTPSQVVATQAYSIHADYGEIVPDWRMYFTATYWGSHFSDKTMRTFRDSLRKVINDPSGDDTLDVGRITMSDIALTAEGRFFPSRLRVGPVRPYLGLGIGAHVLNAEGKAISGTFAERALDNITAGVAGLGGVDVVLFRRVGLGVQGRFDLLSGSRFASLRGVGTYYLDRLPKPRRAR